MEAKLEASIPMEIIDTVQLETRQRVQLDIIADRDGLQVCIIEDGLASYYIKLTHDKAEGFTVAHFRPDGEKIYVCLDSLND